MSELIFGVVTNDSSSHGYETGTVILVGPRSIPGWYIVKEFENTSYAKPQVNMNEHDFALLPTLDIHFSANQEVIYIADHEINPEVQTGDIMIVRAIYDNDYICEMKNEKNAFNIVRINDITPLIL